METLVITSLNSRGFNVSKPPYINDVLVKSDVLSLQKHWLSESQLSVFCDLNPDFLAHAISGINSDHILHGRPYGGCAILIRKSLDIHIKRVNCDSRRIIALLLTFKCVELLLINVYLPCERLSNSDDSYEFMLQLSYIADIIDSFPHANVVVG
jgi:hypothetical protein